MINTLVHHIVPPPAHDDVMVRLRFPSYHLGGTLPYMLGCAYGSFYLDPIVTRQIVVAQQDRLKPLSHIVHVEINVTLIPRNLLHLNKLVLQDQELGHHASVASWDDRQDPLIHQLLVTLSSTYCVLASIMSGVHYV